MKHILFVCTGNTCRSCMAEAIFRDIIERDSALKGKFTASSVGLAALNGEEASYNAVTALRELWGMELSCHRAKAITKQDIDSAAIILTMVYSHKEAIVSKFPQCRDKVFTLKEYAEGDEIRGIGERNRFLLDIADPFGGSLEVYKKCAADIKSALEKAVTRLKKEW